MERDLGGYKCLPFVDRKRERDPIRERQSNGLIFFFSFFAGLIVIKDGLTLSKIRALD
jgi:hypothetical protein